MKYKISHPLRPFLFWVLWLGFLWTQLILFSSPTNQPRDLDDFPPPTSPAYRLAKTANTNASPPKRRKPGDAIFNNIDVYYKKNPNQDTRSDVRCIGRDLNDPELHTNFSWMFRSCEFQNLCLDTESKEFILVGDPSNGNHELALGSINPRWSGRGFNKGFHKVKWFPRWDTTTMPEGYYQLPDDVVMIPFHSMAAHNVGHLLWDDFYPIFTLLSLFDYVSTSSNRAQHQILMLRWAPEKKLFATCEIRKNKGQLCDANFQRFLPLMGVQYNTFSTVKKAELRSTTSQLLKSKYVCSKQAVAGIGMLMDHGLKDHGWTLRDPNSGVDLVPHNLGRGGIFREFRNFMVQNMGFPLELSHSSRRKVTFSTHSSRGFERDLSFENQTAVVRRALESASKISQVIVQNITMRELSLEDQIQVALESAIYVTVCGGGAVTATFLPPGSTLIIYYAEDGGFDYWKYNYTFNIPEYDFQAQPARLDWDLLGNAAHLKVHWLPLKSMESSADLKVLEKLVLHDLEGMGLLK